MSPPHGSINIFTVTISVIRWHDLFTLKRVVKSSGRSHVDIPLLSPSFLSFCSTSSLQQENQSSYKMKLCLKFLCIQSYKGQTLKAETSVGSCYLWVYAAPQSLPSFLLCTLLLASLPHSTPLQLVQNK